MDLATIQKLNENLTTIGKAFEEFKTRNEQSLKDRDVLLEDMKKKLADEISTKHEAALQLIKAEVAQQQRPAGGDSPEIAKEAREAEEFAVHRKSVQGDESSPIGLNSLRNTYGKEFPGFEGDVAAYQRYRKAFLRYIQVGDRSTMPQMSAEQQKDMSIGIDPDGGYFLLPPTVASKIVARMFETSPMRELADVANISTRSLVIPEDPSDINAGWVAERTARTTTSTITPGRVEIPAQEEYAEPALSQQLLEDAAVDIDSYIANKIADKLMRLENTAFVSGNGSGKPMGFLSYPTVVVSSGNFSGFGKLEQVNSGSSANFVYAGLVRLVTSLKEPFQGNAKFLIRRQSLFNLLTLEDGNGRLIFQPLLNGNLNKTPLMGYDLRYATDMPDLGAGANAMAFGDFKEGYQIADRVGISILRDPYTAKPFVLVYTRKRVGGAVKNFDAIKIHSLQ